MLNKIFKQFKLIQTNVWFVGYDKDIEKDIFVIKNDENNLEILAREQVEQGVFLFDYLYELKNSNFREFLCRLNVYINENENKIDVQKRR